MATLDTIKVCNPTDRDFEVYFDKERYKLRAGEEVVHTQYLARHMAKHLSDRELAIQWAKEEVKYRRKKELAPSARKTQLLMYDNPERRIWLYKILKNKVQVEETLAAYPQFGVRSSATGKREFECIGDISIYDSFVDALETKSKKVETEEEPSKIETKKTA